MRQFESTRAHQWIGAALGAAFIASSVSGQIIPDGFDRLIPGSLNPDTVFGTAITVGDFNGDGHDDAAIGGPGDMVSGVEGSGSVRVYFGEPEGFNDADEQIVDQDDVSCAINGEGDGFGRAVAAGDFDGDSYDDLAIGTPGKDSIFGEDSGSVVIVYGFAGGLDLTNVQCLAAGFSGLPGSPSAFDQFGAALAVGNFDGVAFDDLVIGAPLEEADVVPDAGAVTLVYGSAAGLDPGSAILWHQNTPVIPGAAEEGDRFGAVLATGSFVEGYDEDCGLAIGVPDEDLFDTFNTGAVVVVNRCGPVQTAQQLSRPTLPGPQGSGQLGSSLAVGNFDCTAGEDLAVGAPADTLEGQFAAGGVVILYSAGAAGITSDGAGYYQRSQFGGEPSQLFDSFGAGLAAGDFEGDGCDDLAIGAPLEELDGSPINSGTTFVMFSRNAVFTHFQDLTTDFFGSFTSQSGENFGAAIAVGDVRGHGSADLIVGAPRRDWLPDTNPNSGFAFRASTTWIFGDGFESGDLSRWEE